MDEGTYGELLNLVGPKIRKKDTHMCDAISPNQRLSVILRILATGNSVMLWKFLKKYTKF